MVDYTAQMQAAYAAWLARDAALFPELPVVFAILAGGAPVQVERLRSRGFDDRSAMHPNVYFDTSSYGRRALGSASRPSASLQLVHGSDVPVIDARPTLDAVRDSARPWSRSSCARTRTGCSAVTIRSMSDVERWIRERIPGGEDVDQARLADLAVELGGERLLWRQLVRHDANERVYEELYRDVHLDIWLICWAEEQDTGFHDHDSSCGAVYIADGSLPRTVCSSGARSAR